MLFFSHILNASVRNQADEEVGKLVDLIIKGGTQLDHPPVLGAVIKIKGKKEECFVKSINIESYAFKNVTLKKFLPEVCQPLPTEKDIIFLRRTILDKQIIDLKGIRVVRVNDLQLGYLKEIMSLVTIDVGLAGLLRRLGLEKFGPVLKPKLIEWRHVHLVGHKLQLPTMASNIIKLHPADIANIVEKLNLNQGSALLESMDQFTAARVLEEVEPEVQKILVSKWGPERAALVMQKMSVDELVDLIQLLPSRESRDILGKLSSDNKVQKVKQFLEYDENKAGGLMTTEYVSAKQENTVLEIIEHIRRVSHLHHSIYFVYIIDNEDNLVGVVSLRRLLIAKKEEKIGDIMKKAKRLRVAMVGEELLKIASRMTKYNLFSIAVVDKKGGKLLGVVTVDDIMRHFVPHA